MELKKLTPLTSLRFFAASLIIFYHSLEAFSFNKPNLAYDQGVSFFFVLSGFILTYVYPSLTSTDEVKHFFLARFARIWPVYFFCFLLVVVTLPKTFWITFPNGHIWPRMITNLLLIQAWIPRYDYFFSFDSPSWSISTELFFYLCFPFLITRLKNTWFKKITLSLLLVFGIIFLCKFFHLVDVTHTPPQGISTDGLVYINPLARLFEFVLGMCTALLFMNLKQRYYQYPTFFYTAVEIILIFCVFGSLYYTYILFSQPIFLKIFGEGGIKWFCVSAIAPFAAALIFVMAIGKGKISQILTTKIFVRLGEISYALYLIHFIALVWFLSILNKVHLFSHHALYFLYWLTILACSYFIFQFIEKPARKFILQQRYRISKPLITANLQ